MKEKLEKQLAALIKNKVCIAFSAGVDMSIWAATGNLPLFWLNTALP